MHPLHPGVCKCTSSALVCVGWLAFAERRGGEVVAKRAVSGAVLLEGGWGWRRFCIVNAVSVYGSGRCRDRQGATNCADVCAGVGCGKLSEERKWVGGVG